MKVFLVKSIYTHITTDSFDSTEHIVKINSQMRIPFFNQYLELIPHVELINTDFVRGYYNDQILKFQKEWAVGASVFECWEKTKLYWVPKDLPFWRYRRRQSDIFCLSQSRNFYKSAVKMGSLINYKAAMTLTVLQLLSRKSLCGPTLTIKPTQVNHHGDLGFNAYPGSGLSFRLNAHYSHYDNFPLFKRLPYDHNNRDMAYRLANAYQVIYDSVEKMGIVTRIAMRFSEYNKISLETGYFKYDRNGDQKVWNVPSLNIELNANFRLGRELFFQVGGNYIGDRDTVRNKVVLLSENNNGNFETNESLGSVFSIVSSITWKINAQWDLFYQGNMFLSKNTSRWAYYQNQSQVHLGGCVTNSILICNNMAI